MDAELELALTLAELKLRTGDEDAIRQEVLEMRATGIFSPEMYEHLNQLGDPKKQLRAMIDAIRMEEKIKEQAILQSGEDIDPKTLAAFEAINKLPPDQQFDLIEEAINMRKQQLEEPEPSRQVSSSGVMASDYWVLGVAGVVIVLVLIELLG